MSPSPSSSVNGSSSVVEDTDASSLDHALLESIFYNEMMMLDDSASLISSSLLSTLAADGSVMREPPVEEQEAFASPLVSPDTTIPPTTNVTLLEQIPTTPATQEYSSLSSSKPDVTLYQSGKFSGTTTTRAATKPKTKAVAITQQHHQPPLLSIPPAVAPSPLVQKIAAAPRRTLMTPTPPPASDNLLSDAEKRQKLVSQFSALAARLGITLPEPVVQSLTQSKNTTVSEALLPEVLLANPADLSITKPAVEIAASLASASMSPCSPPTNGCSSTIVEELAKVADAAVAAASRKRTVNTSGDESETASADHPHHHHNKDKDKKQAPYSKRRKKPRLQDCESKLADLQAENAMLKRHLNNLSSRSAALDHERNMQQQRMVLMLQDQTANDAELEDALKHFQEMYSDYGRRRHSELNFHLDQLQRLANPTNFTKLGLWTMGQQSKNSRNPIAGILQKELGISAQQGKKILEQRKRIQDVCSNLKECLGLLANLKALCKQKTQIFHDRISKCREILTPRQVVQLITWINENTDMLESVCPGWGSEHIHSKKTAST